MDNNAFNSWINGCYDEDGYGIICDCCNGDVVWKDGTYICSECKKVFERTEYFNYIGAEPPDPKCIFCYDNYPICKRWCNDVIISKDDYWKR